MSFNIFIELDNILHGGGYQKKTHTSFSNTIRQQFIDYGWRKKFINENLHNLNDEFITDYSTKDIIIGFSLAWYKRFTNDNVYSSITSLFYTIGLKKTISQKLEYILQPLHNSCYTNRQIIELGIEYILGKYTPKINNDNNYLYSYAIDNWVSHTNTNKLKILNASYDCHTYMENKNIMQTIYQLQYNTQHTLYYHITAWKFFRSISKSIHHSCGRPCLDFGLTPGFYLTDQIHTALEWGIKKQRLFSNEVCMFIFSIPQTLPKRLRVKYLNNKEWEHVVSVSRKCNSENLDDVDFDMINDIDNTDFIYGNVASNPKQIKLGKSPKIHNPTKTQMVSKTTNADKYIQKHMLGCVFFNKKL
jgi:hypothetical protein